MGISNGNQCGLMAFKFGVVVYYRKGGFEIRGGYNFSPPNERGRSFLFATRDTILPSTAHYHLYNVILVSSTTFEMEGRHWPHTCRQVGGGLQFFTRRNFFENSSPDFPNPLPVINARSLMTTGLIRSVESDWPFHKCTLGVTLLRKCDKVILATTTWEQKIVSKPYSYHLRRAHDNLKRSILQ